MQVSRRPCIQSLLQQFKKKNKKKKTVAISSDKLFLFFKSSKWSTLQKYSKLETKIFYIHTILPDDDSGLLEADLTAQNLQIIEASNGFCLKDKLQPLQNP